MSSKKKLGWFLLSSASLAAMGALSPAMAQDADVSDEIVVTATGRASAIQDVPIAVTAVNAETVQNAGVENLLDMQQLAPSLRIGSGQSTTAGTQARIRGLGTGSDNPGFESAVGFFIDGVYRARAGIAISDLPEVERIEVLRGPQGTLFGRNTSSGAIAVYTAGPEFDPGIWMEAGLGDLDYASAKLGANLPLSDTFALRFDGSVRARDGILNDLNSGRTFNNQNRSSVRGQAQWDISPDASLRVIADAASTDEDCCAATIIQYGTAQAILNSTYLALAGGYAAFLPSFSTVAVSTLPNTSSAAGAGIVNDPEARMATVTPGRDYGEEVDEAGISAQLDWDIGGMNFTSITAYRDWDTNRNQDIDFGVVDLFNREGLEIDISTFTQEFRLQGENGALNWLVGVFYSNEDLDTTDRIRLGAKAWDYTNAVTFARTAGGPLGAREMSDLTSAGVDTLFFGGVDPVPSLLGAINPAFNQTYVAANPSGSGQVADNWTQTAEDIAIFTHNEIALSDALTLTAGLRYTSSTKDIEGVLNSNNVACGSMQPLEVGFGLFSGLNAAANGPPSVAQAGAVGIRTLLALACSPQQNTAANRTAANPWVGSREENEFSGTVSLSYHVNEDLMIYGGYSRGYKAGGFNLDRSSFTGLFPGMTAAQANTQLNTDQLGFEPEFTDAYELGMRSTVFGNTFLNVTLFHETLTDYQLNAFNGTAFITRNLPEAISQGVEVDILARLTDSFSIQAGANYTDASNTDTVAFVTNSAADTIYQDTGLTQAPQYSFTTAITYEMPLGSSMGALFYLDARYDSSYRTQALDRNTSNPSNPVVSDQDAAVTVNGRVGIGPTNDRWSLELWGRNLTDELIFGGFNLPLQTGSRGAFVNEPRTYGVTLRARY